MARGQHKNIQPSKSFRSLPPSRGAWLKPSSECWVYCGGHPGSSSTSGFAPHWLPEPSVSLSTRPEKTIGKSSTLGRGYNKQAASFASLSGLGWGFHWEAANRQEQPALQCHGIRSVYMVIGKPPGCPCPPLGYQSRYQLLEVSSAPALQVPVD